MRVSFRLTIERSSIYAFPVSYQYAISQHGRFFIRQTLARYKDSLRPKMNNVISDGGKMNGSYLSYSRYGRPDLGFQYYFLTERLSEAIGCDNLCLLGLMGGAYAEKVIGVITGSFAFIHRDESLVFVVK